MAQLREQSSMLKLFTEHVKGEDMYGLTIHAVMRITESVRRCWPFSPPPFKMKGDVTAALKKDRPLFEQTWSVPHFSCPEWRTARTTSSGMAAIH